MFGSIKQMNKSYRELYKQPENPLKSISDHDLKGLELLIKQLNIESIGYTIVNSDFIFSNKKILYKNAIVILMEMEPEIIKTVPSKAAEKEIFRTYYELNVAVNKIKDFLNEREYNAEAGPALGGEVNYPLLAQKAGLGVIGKNSMLISPEFGPSLRIAAVYTDIDNLPYNDSTEHLWVNEFCDRCNRCVNKCLGKAIYNDPIIFEDGSKQCIDYKKYLE